MAQRYDVDSPSVCFEAEDGYFVKYEDYAALKTHADAMCEAMCLYDLGERVSFESYLNYSVWLSKVDK